MKEKSLQAEGSSLDSYFFVVLCIFLLLPEINMWLKSLWVCLLFLLNVMVGTFSILLFNSKFNWWIRQLVECIRILLIHIFAILGIDCFLCVFILFLLVFKGHWTESIYNGILYWILTFPLEHTFSINFHSTLKEQCILLDLALNNLVIGWLFMTIWIKE